MYYVFIYYLIRLQYKVRKHDNLSSNTLYIVSRVWVSHQHDWKSCIPQKGIEGSNPSFSAKRKTTHRVAFLLAFKVDLKNKMQHRRALSASAARAVHFYCTAKNTIRYFLLFRKKPHHRCGSFHMQAIGGNAEKIYKYSFYTCIFIGSVIV